jgi:hypothetical protein
MIKERKDELIQGQGRVNGNGDLIGVARIQTTKFRTPQSRDVQQWMESRSKTLFLEQKSKYISALITSRCTVRWNDSIETE